MTAQHDNAAHCKRSDPTPTRPSDLLPPFLSTLYPSPHRPHRPLLACRTHSTNHTTEQSHANVGRCGLGRVAIPSDHDLCACVPSLSHCHAAASAGVVAAGPLPHCHAPRVGATQRQTSPTPSPCLPLSSPRRPAAILLRPGGGRPSFAQAAVMLLLARPSPCRRTAHAHQQPSGQPSASGKVGRTCGQRSEFEAAAHLSFGLPVLCSCEHLGGPPMGRGWIRTTSHPQPNQAALRPCHSLRSFLTPLDDKQRGRQPAWQGSGMSSDEQELCK